MSDRPERLLGAPERRSRSFADFEVRRSTADENKLTFSGYASLFDNPYEILGGPDKGGWIEVVDPHAFDRTLKANPDVVLLINHEGMPLARTTSGTMKLVADAKGLQVNASLDLRDPDVQALNVKMERGDLDQMSFAFRAIRNEWSNEDTERRLLEVSIDRGDVSIVNNGAQPDTTSSIRFADACAYFDSLALTEVRSLDGDPLASLTAVHETIGHLVAQLRPADTRGRSVALVERLMQLDSA